jgi:hypothetical protein
MFFRKHLFEVILVVVVIVVVFSVMLAAHVVSVDGI